MITVLIAYNNDEKCGHFFEDCATDIRNHCLTHGVDVQLLTPPDLTEEQFATLDKIAMAVAGVPSITDIYVKGDKWGQLYKNDLAKLATSIGAVSKSVEAKADPMMVESIPYNKQLSPNTYYSILY